MRENLSEHARRMIAAHENAVGARSYAEFNEMARVKGAPPFGLCNERTRRAWAAVETSEARRGRDLHGVFMSAMGEEREQAQFHALSLFLREAWEAFAQTRTVARAQNQSERADKKEADKKENDGGND